MSARASSSRRRPLPRVALRAALGAVTLGAGLLGCLGERGLSPDAREPFLYVLLATASSDDTSGLRGILMTSGDPARADYVRPQAIEMTRVGEAATFAWETVQVGSPPASFAGLALAGAGNLRLPRSGDGGRLGRADLTTGGRYRLRVDLGATEMSGETTIPAPVRLWITVEDSAGPRRRVHWSRVPGAPLYLLASETEMFEAAVVADTTYLLREDASLPTTSSRLRVYALDANLARFWADTTVMRAGLSRGYGVFGSYSVHDTVLNAR